MLLLDHFRPPLHPKHRGDSFHSSWASSIADSLNEDLLPDWYFAAQTMSAGLPIEIDVATFAEDPTEPETTAVATRVYAPPAATMVIPAAFPDTFEVQVYYEEGGAKLVAAIELISPSNKDRPLHRRAFAAKCSGYLSQGIAVMIVDVVTTRRANLHHEILSLFNHNTGMPSAELYAVSYRPVVRDSAEEIEIWTNELSLGEPLPTLPLWLNAQICLPINLDATYSSTCGRRRIP